MSFKEISTWIMVVLFSGLFFLYALPVIETRSFESAGGEQIFGFILAFVVLVTIAHVVVAIIAPKKANEAEDERDRRIELYGERAGSFALGAVCLFGLAVALITEHRLFANIFFLGLVWSEIVKGLWQVALYRRES
ncbi:MAG: hypothetical protein AAGD92_00170 [Pseudomonadota bacterium]